MFYTLYNILSKKFKRIFKKDIYSLAEKGELKNYSLNYLNK
jgi:hypothetical protein